ncbi:hypothetical protein LTR08_004455 [Meristemomyces frigidus]|nr:hypothetical protein LTR08_004455 [Meristemomyces frigidus]
MAAQPQYNNDANYSSSGYGQSNPYDTRGSSFDTRGEQPPPAYGQGQPGARGAYAQHNDVEMQPLTGSAAAENPFADHDNGAPPPQQQQDDPNAILNDCRAVGHAIDDLEARLPDLQRLQRAFTSGTGATNKDIDATSADILTGYRGLADRVKRIKTRPAAASPRNRAQVDALDRRIRKAITTYQQTESAFRKEVQDQQRRQYLIVRPEATEAEITSATAAGGDQQIFQQALLNSDRRGQAQSTLRNVRERQDAILNIERTMLELQQLFQDLDEVVVMQEPLVQRIEQKAEETNTHLEAGNVHVEQAVGSARAARKKKWICLGIVVAILILIIIIILAWGGTTQGWFKSN